MKSWLTIALSITSGVLLVVSAVLAVALFQKPRFTPMGNGSQYIMFDNKTAQACWSGAGNESADPYLKALGATDTPPHLPFCKDLK